MVEKSLRVSAAEFRNKLGDNAFAPYVSIVRLRRLDRPGTHAVGSTNLCLTLFEQTEWNTVPMFPFALNIQTNWPPALLQPLKNESTQSIGKGVTRDKGHGPQERDGRGLVLRLKLTKPRKRGLCPQECRIAGHVDLFLLVQRN